MKTDNDLMQTDNQLFHKKMWQQVKSIFWEKRVWSFKTLNRKSLDLRGQWGTIISGWIGLYASVF